MEGGASASPVAFGAGFRLGITMMRRFAVLVAGMVFGSGCLLAQGTKLWTVGRYEELERGSTDGVAIRNDGRLEAAPATSLIYTTAGNYVWSVAADANGNAYLGTGGTISGSASVMLVGMDGKAAKIFEGKELGVQAVRVGADGTVFVATSPDGKVYRIPKGGGTPFVVFDPATTPEKSKYLWDIAVGAGGELYIAAGAPAAVYKVAGGKTELMFRTADQHIRCLLMSRSGMLWAGTDGGGVVYRVDPRQAGAKPFAMYAAAQREVTALAEDAAGNVYAAGVGSKAGTSLPPLPVTGAVGVTVTFVQPGSTGAVSGSALVPEGSELYRIAADGTPSRLLSLKEDVVYGLAVRDGALIVATGNRGRVYRVDLGMAGRFADIAHLEASQGTALATAPDGGLLIGTSNSGKLYRLGGTAKAATYTSEVFDAGGFTRWGRAEVRAEVSGYGMFVRVGNVPSPVEGWSDWVKLEGGVGKIPDGRFAQWKMEFGGGAAGVEAVGLNYLQRNVAPVVDDVAVQVGARIAPGTGVAASTTVQVAFPAPVGTGMATGFLLPTGDAGAGPLTAQKDRNAVTVRWTAHDDNGDDLMFSVYARGAGEKNFRLLKEKVSDRFLSFDAVALPDGPYVLKVVASDGPSHTDPETLTGERVSGVFVVDTTAPVVSGLKAAMSSSAGRPVAGRVSLAVSFEAADATSPISHAEYSLDAGPWEYVEPEGKLSDGMRESYRFMVPVDVPAGGSLVDPAEHVLAVRVYDRFENVGSEKVVVH